MKAWWKKRPKRPRWLHWPRKRKHRIWAWCALGVIAALLLWVLLAWLFKPKDKGPPPSAVTVATAQRREVQIILRGLGQVQAFNTYTAKSRVDGNITEIGYKEGQQVQAGALLVRVDPRPYQAALEQAQATEARDQAQLANAKLDLNRYAQLLPQGLTTKQTYDTQVATVKQLQATVKSDAAQVDSARVNLGYTSIRAPFGGRTGQRLVDIGNLVSAASQTPLVVLTQTQPIFVSFTLPELNLGKVVASMHQGPVKVMAFDSDDAQPIAGGTLTVLDNTVDPGTGTVRLKAQFNNQDEKLWPGEFVNAHLVVAVERQGIVVPAGAVQMGPNGRFVFRVAAQNKVEVVPVTVGQIDNGQALIDSGLRAHDRIVVDGAFGLSAGDAVQVTGQAIMPGTPGTLDMTGRTTDSNPSGPQAPTERQSPQRQTPQGGRTLNGSEGPGARTPLPDQRQVPEPPPSKGSHSQASGQ